MNFLSGLKQRNKLLFWFGLFNLAIGLICFVLMQVDDKQVLNVNRWLKPVKFYFAVGLMILTMGWLLYYLADPKKIRRYSRMLVFTMFFENGLILLQAIRQTTSHYNVKTTFDMWVFNLMGIFILIFTITCIRICISFFRQKQFSISSSYLWGIRLGLLFFIIFSVEGGLMLSLMKHTVGAPDGGAGLPFVNWSRDHGDLRIAHFFGIHSLQILPLLGYYVARSKRQVIVFGFLYFALVVALLIQALTGTALLF